MKKIILLLLSLLCFAEGLQAQVPGADTADYSIVAKDLQDADGAPLSAPWKFRVGDSIAWAEPGYDDRHWARVATDIDDEVLPVLRKAGFSGRAWFRTSFQLDSAAAAKALALHVVNGGAMSIYLDGVLLETYGSFDTQGVHTYEDQELPVMLNIKAPGRHTLAVRFEKKGIDGEGVFSSDGFAVSILSADVAIWREQKKLQGIAVFLLPAGSVFLTLFFVHLLLFLYYRQDKSNFYFALFNFGVAVLLLLLYAILNTTGVSRREWLSGVWISGILLSVFALSTFINHLFGSFGWRYKIVVCFCILSLVAFLFFLGNDLFSYVPLVLFFGVAAEAVILIIRAIMRKIPGAKILGVGILFFFGSIAFIAIIAALTGGFSVDGNNKVALILMILFFVLFIFSIPLSISGYLAWKVSNTNKSLQREIATVESLSLEKQAILEGQKEQLEKEVLARTVELTRKKEEVEQEKQKTDDLLLNILPAEVAEELKRDGKSKAQHYSEVSVLFTDFVNFTHIAEQLEPDELIAELNVCFTAFDNIMEQYGLEKIKTIGDAYLAVSGLPVQRPDHALNAVKAALDVVAFVNRRKEVNTLGFEIRVGINSGPLVAGIVGVKKFAYDIWGDTVNMASRMESNSESGRINISESTHALVRHDFTFIHRGKVNAKNKGDVDMYFVEALKPTTDKL